MSSDIERISKEIDDYNKTVEGEYNFEEILKDILFQANGKKNEDPKSPVTRRWAVFYTEVEKVLAYYDAYLKSKGDL